MNPKIFLSSPHMGGGEMKYIAVAFEQNWIAPLGPNVNEFEKELARAVDVKHVAALSSGTSAIHLALILLGVKQGDHVIASSFTFSATVNPIAYQGAVPVLVDSESDTWNMDPKLLEKAIQDKRQKAQDKSIKAIIVAHLYGMPAKMREINEIAGRYGIPVIEDAAEALGSEYMGKRVGNNTVFGILSFNGNKIITTSGGGALLSDDEALIKRARFLATQARDPAPHYQHSTIGYNYRMSNIVAGIGRGQLEVLDERVRQRRAVNAWYRGLLKDVPGVSLQTEPSGDFYSNYWLTCIIIDPEKSGTDRERLRKAFEAENIEARPLWKPMHLQPVFEGCPAYVNGTSEALFNKGLCLPSGSNLTGSEMSRIEEVLRREFHF
jgi:dTDP-4-amino-4,6-dideoxygalactose transaminase